MYHPPTSYELARPRCLTCAIWPSMRRGFGQAAVVTLDPVTATHLRWDWRWPCPLGPGTTPQQPVLARRAGARAGPSGYGDIT